MTRLLETVFFLPSSDPQLKGNLHLAPTIRNALTAGGMGILTRSGILIVLSLAVVAFACTVVAIIQVHCELETGAFFE